MIREQLVIACNTLVDWIPGEPSGYFNPTSCSDQMSNRVVDRLSSTLYHRSASESESQILSNTVGEEWSRTYN